MSPKERTPYLIVLERGEINWSTYAPDLPSVVATGSDEQDTERRMREALALYLYEMAQDGEAVPAQTATPTHYPNREASDVAHFVEPAPLNPVNLEVKRALAATGKSLRQLAQKIGISQPTLSRLQNPFYWGHTVATLRGLADALGVRLQVKFADSESDKENAA